MKPEFLLRLWMSTSLTVTAFNEFCFDWDACANLTADTIILQTSIEADKNSYQSPLNTLHMNTSVGLNNMKPSCRTVGLPQCLNWFKLVSLTSVRSAVMQANKHS